MTERQYWESSGSIHAGRRGRSRSGGVITWLAMLLMSVGVAQGTPADASRESLDSFPKGRIEITTAEGVQQFQIWIADTVARSEQGLMFVQSLAHDRGMLFPRNNPGPMVMWMKNTLIPLDMLFLDAEGEIVYIRHQATPQSEAIIKVPAPITTPVVAVLELSGGECDRRHISQGDHLRILPAAS